jgi:hypothetical protein
MAGNHLSCFSGPATVSRMHGYDLAAWAGFLVAVSINLKEILKPPEGKPPDPPSVLTAVP